MHEPWPMYFLDYTFLTDFFLIYRLFISPPALLRLLMARFHWALTEDTPQRQIVRVRTFVVLRHWLLNYFDYDFMGFRLLRRTLIQNLKLLITHPIIRSSVRDQRIVHELRRLFQLKRKQYSHTAAQRSLEGSNARREHSIRSVQHSTHIISACILLLHADLWISINLIMSFFLSNFFLYTY